MVKQRINNNNEGVWRKPEQKDNSTVRERWKAWLSERLGLHLRHTDRSLTWVKICHYVVKTRQTTKAWIIHSLLIRWPRGSKASVGRSNLPSTILMERDSRISENRVVLKCTVMFSSTGMFIRISRWRDENRINGGCMNEWSAYE